MASDQTTKKLSYQECDVLYNKRIVIDKEVIFLQVFRIQSDGRTYLKIGTARGKSVGKGYVTIQIASHEDWAKVIMGIYDCSKVLREVYPK